MTYSSIPECPDAELLRIFAATRSAEVFRRLVERHLPTVHSAAERILRPALARHADDIAQSVFILLAQNAGKIPASTPLIGWLYQVTHYACANLQRRERNRQRHEQETAAMRSELSLSHAITDAEALLDPALLSLNVADRQVLLLRYAQDLSVADIALTTRLPAETIKKRLQRALEKLRKYFATHGLPAAMPGALQALTPIPSAVLASKVTAITSVSLAPMAASVGSATGVLVAQSVAHMMHVWHLTKIAAAVTAVLVPAVLATVLLIKSVGPASTVPATGGTPIPASGTQAVPSVEVTR